MVKKIALILALALVVSTAVLFVNGHSSRKLPQHAEAIADALDKQLRAADPQYIYFSFDDIYTQLVPERKAWRAPNVYMYDVKIQVPDLTSVTPESLGYTPPLSVHEADAYEQSVLTLMRTGIISQTETHEVSVTVELRDGHWVCSKPYVGWIREHVTDALRFLREQATTGGNVA